MLDTAQQVGITTQERGNEEGGTERLRRAMFHVLRIVVIIKVRKYCIGA